MTRDDIIRLARDELIRFHHPDSEWVQQIDNFAALVAAHEREACLKLCDTNDFFGKFGYDDVDAIKAAIRARGEK
jgi:hypothetical protein